ncbi:MAG TPA: response regulator [Polyangia bacterium]|jgi:CheY-like chemotaxis protein|nr:response regulator [Polyangia bacterium]
MEQTRAGRPTRVSVLVADDDDDIRDSIKEVLEDEGYTVVVAAHGEEALEQLTRVRPQLILLDLSMPVMNGQEFRKAQLADAALKEIPVVVLSAAGRMQEKAAGMDAADLVAKPIKLEKLLLVVRRFCGDPER